jgi:hypothetical protein
LILLKSGMGGSIRVVIKPVNWRQLAFSGFLFMTAFFFSVVGNIGVFFSWLGTIGFAIFGLLNLLDFFFEWSRLLINKDGYNLRGWWRRQHFRHEEIESFASEKYGGRLLLTVKLKKNALQNRGLKEEPIPFPCSFGRPVEEVLEVLKKNLDKTARKI